MYLKSREARHDQSNRRIEFDELDMPRQTWQCIVKHTRLRGKLPWFYQLAVRAVWGHSRELQIKV